MDASLSDSVQAQLKMQGLASIMSESISPKSGVIEKCLNQVILNYAQVSNHYIAVQKFEYKGFQNLRGHVLSTSPLWENLRGHKKGFDISSNREPSVTFGCGLLSLPCDHFVQSFVKLIGIPFFLNGNIQNRARPAYFDHLHATWDNEMLIQFEDKKND
jgi:hypothetical protein